MDGATNLIEEIDLEDVIVSAAIGSGVDDFGTAVGTMKLAAALVVGPAKALTGTKALGGSHGNAYCHLLSQAAHAGSRVRMSAGRLMSGLAAMAVPLGPPCASEPSPVGTLYFLRDCQFCGGFARAVTSSVLHSPSPW